jgi:predicted metal-dependent peptidase
MPSESVNIYLDVSGSMNAEIDRLITLLSGFRSHIRRPLWVFSNKVDKAVFRNGKIEYESTGGTSISCVFDHIREKGFRRSLIVTDGYVESISPVMLRGISLRDLHVLVSANGQGQPFYAHGIRYHQLKPVKP